MMIGSGSFMGTSIISSTGMAMFSEMMVRLLPQIWKSQDFIFEFDEDGKVAEKSIPPKEMRPNVLLFNDGEWNTQLSDAQELKYEEFLAYSKD